MINNLASKMVARLLFYKTLINENREKRHKLGAGVKRYLDTGDEEFIARSIEETSTTHGRCHDTILYSNHWVKNRHFLSLANYNLQPHGKFIP